MSAYAQQQLAYLDRMFLNFAVRGDQNTAFGTDIGWIWYPSVSGSWVLSEEAFFPENDIVSELRLRGAVGQAGLRPGATDALLQFGSAIGTFQSISVAFLPALLGQLNTEHPDLEARLVESDDEALLADHVVTGQLDVSFVLGAQDPEALDEGLGPTVGAPGVGVRPRGEGVDERHEPTVLSEHFVPHGTGLPDGFVLGHGWVSSHRRRLPRPSRRRPSGPTDPRRAPGWGRWRRRRTAGACAVRRD